MADDIPFFPARLSLAVAQNMTNPRQPLLVTGYAHMPGGEVAPVMGRIDLQKRTFELHTSILGKPPKRPRGAPPHYGKRVAALMLYDWLLGGQRKKNKGDVYAWIAETMQFNGSDDSKKRSVMRMLYSDPKTKAIAKEIKGRQVIGAIDDTSGAGYWFMPDHRLSALPTDGTTIPGWLLTTEAPKEAVHGSHRFATGDATGDGHFLAGVVALKPPEKG